MVSVAEQYSIETYTPEDEPQVLALLQDSLGEDVSQWEDGRLWRWKHFESPFETSFVYVAKSPEGRVLGVRALMRWNFTAGGRVYTAIRPVDTATWADCRGQGIFPALTKHGMADARSRGIDLMFNTPNEMSRPGYLKMGWTLLTEAYPSYKVVNWAGFGFNSAKGIASRVLKIETSGEMPAFEDFSAKRLDAADPNLRETLRLEREWQSRGGQMMVERTPEYMVWRYAQDPVQDHWIVWNDPSSPVAGFCVVRPMTTGLGPRTAVIEEIVLAQPDARQVKQLLRRVREVFGVHFLQGHFSPSSFYGMTLKNMGFRKISRNGMSVVVNPLSEHLDFDLTCLDRWALGMGELELF